MANISKKETKKRFRQKLKELGYNVQQYLSGRLSLQGHNGKSPRTSKRGKISNQKGAFGTVGWMRGLAPGIYETFSMTNHERCKAKRAKKEAMKRIKDVKVPLIKEL